MIDVAPINNTKN